MVPVGTETQKLSEVSDVVHENSHGDLGAEKVVFSSEFQSV